MTAGEYEVADDAPHRVKVTSGGSRLVEEVEGRWMVRGLLTRQYGMGWKSLGSVELPPSLWPVAKSLGSASGGAEPLAQRALCELMSDVVKLRAAGAPDRAYWDLGDRWQRVVKRLFEEAFVGQLGVDRFESVLAALDELDKVDPSKGLPA